MWFLDKLDRQKQIHEKGFKMSEYGHIKVVNKTLSDVSLDLGALKQA